MKNSQPGEYRKALTIVTTLRLAKKHPAHIRNVLRNDPETARYVTTRRSWNRLWSITSTGLGLNTPAARTRIARRALSHALRPGLTPTQRRLVCALAAYALTRTIKPTDDDPDRTLDTFMVSGGQAGLWLGVTQPAAHRQLGLAVNASKTLSVVSHRRGSAPVYRLRQVPKGAPDIDPALTEDLATGQCDSEAARIVMAAQHPAWTTSGGDVLFTYLLATACVVEPSSVLSPSQLRTARKALVESGLSVSDLSGLDAWADRTGAAAKVEKLRADRDALVAARTESLAAHRAVRDRASKVVAGLPRIYPDTKPAKAQAWAGTVVQAWSTVDDSARPQFRKALARRLVRDGFDAVRADALMARLCPEPAKAPDSEDAA